MTLLMKNLRTVAQSVTETRPSTRHVPKRADIRPLPLRYHQSLSPIVPPLPRSPNPEVIPHPPPGHRWTFTGPFPTQFPPATRTRIHIPRLNPTG